MRPLFRSLATLVVAVGVVTCTDSTTSAPRPATARSVRSGIALAPVFSKSAAFAAAHMDDFGITFDHVHIVIVRPPDEVVKDTTVAFTPSMTDLTIDITVAAHADGETFDVTMDYVNGSDVIFHGQGNVASHSPD